MFDHLVEVIKTEFHSRKNRNKAYSLRSYSRDLNVDPSNLSKILKGKKTLNQKNAEKIATKLGFNTLEISQLLLTKSHLPINDKSYHSHELKTFQIISHWQHYAILELFKLKDFVFDPKLVAKQLHLPTSVVNESIKRLKDVGLLKYDENRKTFTPVDESSSAILKIDTSKAHRDHQRQILEGAIDALNTVPIEFRSQTSMTMAIDSTKLEEAKEIIKHFRRKMGRLLSQSNQLDEVYQLSISLYPVTHNKISKTNKLKP